MTTAPDRLVTALDGRYRLSRELGAGGMATVYLAEDLRHARQVAIKVLRPELAAALGPERFVREITTTANLRHPHILPLYDSGEAGGYLFYVMPFVDGESLRDRLDRERQLPIEDALRLTREMADALGYAHSLGVIHRDIKPENILLERGHAIVADFGIARAVSSATSEKLTQTGMSIGTPAYMSPEQSVGESDLDARSDLYAVGCVLYEMLAGEPPYSGGSPQAIMAKRFRDPVPRVSTLRETVSPAVESALLRVLAKSPADRFPSASEFIAALSATAHIEGMTSTQLQTARDEGFRIAVLPFKTAASNAELASLGDELAEGIAVGLTRFSYLRVAARTAKLSNTMNASDAQNTDQALGARYVIDGSLRQAGNRLRVAAQLIDTTTGANLWAETYERTVSPDTAFEMQDDLVARVVATCGDRFGVLARSISDAVRDREPSQLSPYEALMRGFGYHLRLTPIEHAAARDALESAVEQAPANADCLAMLSWVYSHEFAHGFNTRTAPLDRALSAARRAVDIAPSNQLAKQALAVVHFFRKEQVACLSAAERAVELNPLDSSNEAMFLIAFCGQWDRGMALIRRAIELNPHHPRWYEWVVALNEFRQGNYRESIDETLKANLPEVFWTHMLLAAAYGHLGEMDAARAALQALFVQIEDFASTGQAMMEQWYDPKLVAHVMEGLRKAGMDAPAVPTSASSLVEAFLVAVLPFAQPAANTDLTALGDGLTEEIIAGLSRFTYLRVIGPSASTNTNGIPTDARTIGTKLGARYMVDGSLRQAGPTLRVSVQLLDTASGTTLWTQTFDRAFQSENIFALQDELASRIVSSVADAHGVLPRTLSESLRSKTADELSPYEAVLRSFGYGYRMNVEEHITVRACLERAVAQAPGYSDAWGMLSLVYTEEYANEFDVQPDPLGRALAAARRAADASPSSALASNALARVLFFRKEFAAFRIAAERAVQLNEFNGPTLVGLGTNIAYAGDWERGCALVERAARLNPNHPDRYWFALFYNAYRMRDYRGALDIALGINLPEFFATHQALAAVYGQLGEPDAARRSVGELLRLKPDFVATVRPTLTKWFDAELTEHVIDGIRKAGLELP